MAYEVGVNWVFLIILAFFMVLAIIGFHIYLRPQIQGGWLTSILDAIKWILEPTV